jgi:hypothetical protein
MLSSACDRPACLQSIWRFDGRACREQYWRAAGRGRRYFVGWTSSFVKRMLAGGAHELGASLSAAEGALSAEQQQQQLVSVACQRYDVNVSCLFSGDAASWPPSNGRADAADDSAVGSGCAIWSPSRSSGRRGASARDRNSTTCKNQKYKTAETARSLLRPSDRRLAAEPHHCRLACGRRRDQSDTKAYTLTGSLSHIHKLERTDFHSDMKWPTQAEPAWAPKLARPRLVRSLP